MLTVEDGTGVANANSFADRAEIIAYAASRGVGLADDETTDIVGIKAMDYLLSQDFIGFPTYPTKNEVPFPRFGIEPADNIATASGLVANVEYDFVVPAAIKRAQLQLCVDISNGIDVTPNRGTDAQLKTRTVGPITREYYERSADDLTPFLPIVSAALKPFLARGSTFSIQTFRA